MQIHDSCAWCYLFSFATDVFTSVYRSTPNYNDFTQRHLKRWLSTGNFLISQYSPIWWSMTIFLFTQSRLVSIKSIKWSLCMWKMSHKLRLQAGLICRSRQVASTSVFSSNGPEWLVKKGVTWRLQKQIEIFLWMLCGSFIPSWEQTYPRHFWVDDFTCPVWWYMDSFPGGHLYFPFYNY